MTPTPKDAPVEPDFERIAINMLRPVRGCATDQQFQDAVANVTAALLECAAGRQAAPQSESLAAAYDADCAKYIADCRSVDIIPDGAVVDFLRKRGVELKEER